MVVETDHLWEVPTRNGLGSVRRETVGGREYLVAPATTIVPGVLPGSRGPLYYPGHEIKRNVKDWDGIPITVHHPYTSNGEHVSVNDPAAVDRRVGVVRKSTYNGKLQHEAWFDAERTRTVDRRVYDALTSNTPMELSTGLLIGDMTRAEPGAAYNGVPYTYTTGNYRPDHLAILPDQTGACSLQDGCGLLINANPEGHNQYTARGASVASKKAHEATKAASSHVHEKARTNVDAEFTVKSSTAAVSASDKKQNASAIHAHEATAKLHEGAAAHEANLGYHDAAAVHTKAAEAHRTAAAYRRGLANNARHAMAANTRPPSLVEQFVRWLVGNTQGRHPDTKQFQPEFAPAARKGFTEGLTHDESGEAIGSEDDESGQGDRDAEEGEIKRKSELSDKDSDSVDLAVGNRGKGGGKAAQPAVAPTPAPSATAPAPSPQPAATPSPTPAATAPETPQPAADGSFGRAMARVQAGATGKGTSKPPSAGKGKKIRNEDDDMPAVTNVDPALLAQVGDGGKVSKMACSASDAAGEKGTPFAHKQAASAHREAAEAHEDEGNDEMAAGHKAVARQHAAAARNLTRNARRKDMTPSNLKELRPKMLQFLTTNCDCPKERAAYNELNDDTLFAVYNAKADSSNEDVTGGGSDQAGGEETTDDHDYESEDNFTPKTKGKGKPFDKPMTENEWLAMAPPGVRERDAYAKKVLNREKLALVQRLVANVADSGRRQALGNKLMACSLEDLAERAELLPATSGRVARNDYQDPTPRYVGATGGRPTTVANAADEGDVLDTYTLNFKAKFDAEDAVVKVG